MNNLQFQSSEFFINITFSCHLDQCKETYQNILDYPVEHQGQFLQSCNSWIFMFGGLTLIQKVYDQKVYIQ